MSNALILGGNKQEQEGDDDKGDSRRVNVTNFLSFGHLIPWGGILDVKRLNVAEVKDRFKDKRVDLFVYPDLELMGEMLQHEAMSTGHMPQGSPEQREEGFCQMVEQAVKQVTGCHVRRVQKPRPAGSDKRTVFVQFFPQSSSGIVGGSMTLGNVWWEIVTKDLRQKPEAMPAQMSESKNMASS